MKLSVHHIGVVVASVWSGAAPAQPAVIDLDSALRCSAAFAILAADQARGDTIARAEYPEVGRRGKEFFVQTGARLIDAERLDRTGLERRLQAEVTRVQRAVSAADDPKAKFKGIVTPCFNLLDLTIPARR